LSGQENIYSYFYNYVYYIHFLKPTYYVLLFSYLYNGVKIN